MQIFDRSGLFCGCILWLLTPRDPQGRLKRPRPCAAAAPAVRPDDPLGLRPAGPGRGGGGWFYSPDDGKTYGVSEEL
ncbi:hypothetical protein KPL78_15560 [Roseomonas sp. HJA6]|uniref:Uncharacterized protein n=1 Tax=Roseomonas alba TaxID=2846776 RepID=A0ABS7AAS2_9PROT|nr:hypothetical protein [Neoroseomonas alba]